METLSDRLEQHVHATEPTRQRSLLTKIITQRSVIRGARNYGHRWNFISEILEREGIHIAEGTLRNYLRLIGKSEEHLAKIGNSDPTPQQIHDAIWHFPTKRQITPTRKAVSASGGPKLGVPGALPSPAHLARKSEDQL